MNGPLYLQGARQCAAIGMELLVALARLRDLLLATSHTVVEGTEADPFLEDPLFHALRLKRLCACAVDTRETPRTDLPLRGRGPL